MRKYVIIDKKEVSNVDFDEVIELSEKFLRYKIDGSQTFVKYEGSKPSFLNDKTVYNHTEIIAILNDPNNGWQLEEDI